MVQMAMKKPSGKYIHNQVLGYVEPWVVAEALHRKLIVQKYLGDWEYWCVVTREEIITQENGRRLATPKKVFKVPDEFMEFKKAIANRTLRPSPEISKLLNNENAKN